MATTTRVYLLTLLLCGMILVGCEAQRDDKVCLQFCYDDIDYMICPSSGSQKLTPACNCCLAPEDGCQIYRADGTLICSGDD